MFSSERGQALRDLMQKVVDAADEAPARESEYRLRDAAARIADAWLIEERIALGERKEAQR